MLPEVRTTGGTETILVVEDDADVRETVVSLLEELGYTIYQASDGAEALGIIEAGRAIDMLFTDVVMPGPVSSTDLAQKAREILPHLAVLFTSGYTNNAIVHGGRLDPGLELLSKPYRKEQLARKLRHMFANQQQLRVNEAALRDFDTLPPTEKRRDTQQVLVVEDNDDMRELACLLLATLGQEPRGVASAEEALDALADAEFDILFTDIGLSGMNGEELASLATRMNPDIKVVFATGYADSDEERSDGTLVLKKPYGLAQIRKTLQTFEMRP